MTRTAKFFLILAICLILIGCAVFGAAMAMQEWDFSKLNNHNFETNTHEITESFGAILVDTDTAYVEVLPSEDGVCRVICREEAKAKHTLSVQQGVLRVELDDNRKWFDYINIGWGTSPKITVYLPNTEYTSLTVRTDTGYVNINKAFCFDQIDVRVSTGNVKCFASCTGEIKLSGTTGRIVAEGISAAKLSVSTSTGGIKLSGVTCEGEVQVQVSTGETLLENVRCQSLSSTGSTGDLELKNVVASGKIFLERSTGDITLQRCDGAELFIETDTGDVEGTLLTEKIFFTETDTGEIDVPKTATGGRCEITTDTGEIEIEIER